MDGAPPSVTCVDAPPKESARFSRQKRLKHTEWPICATFASHWQRPLTQLPWRKRASGTSRMVRGRTADLKATQTDVLDRLQYVEGRERHNLAEMMTTGAVTAQSRLDGEG